MGAAWSTDCTLAFIGLGAMGGRMVRHLNTVRDLLVFDVDAAAAQEVATATGGRAIASVAEAKGADVVILMLPNSAIVDAVVAGDDGTSGLLSVLGKGATIVDMSSSDPIHTRANAALAAEHGIGFIDAPVSGGTIGAEAGSLAIMVGSTEDEFGWIEPLLTHLGSKISRVGDVGGGHVVKALNNLLMATMLLATAEAFTAGERFGIDPVKLEQAVSASSGGSFVSNTIWPRAVESGSYEFGFKLSLMAKDVRIALSVLAATDTASPICDLAGVLCADALAASPAGADMVKVVSDAKESSRATV